MGEGDQWKRMIISRGGMGAGLGVGEGVVELVGEGVVERVYRGSGSSRGSGR